MNIGTHVSLDGTSSFDPDPLDKLTYEWTLLAFPSNGEPLTPKLAALTKGNE